jgi:CDP-glucose 4,6-dehydratase
MGWRNKVSWKHDAANQPHEAHLLKLDCSKARQFLNWLPAWNIETAIEKIIDWHQAFQEKRDMRAMCIEQILSYESSSIKTDEK